MNRVALVIGNSEYLNIGKLNNPKNDANDIASILGKLNFDVEKVIDADLLDIQRSVNKFLQALDEYAVGLFFYAGHGMQIDGKNYIVPVDLKLGDKSRTTVSCYCLNSLLDGAATYKGKTLICILDACRDNPFAIGRGLIAGFAPFDNPPKGTIIAYSTGSDCSAFDGHGSNGLYAIPLNYRHQYIVSCQKEYSVFLGKETEIYMGHALNLIQLAVIQSTALSA